MIVGMNSMMEKALLANFDLPAEMGKLLTSDSLVHREGCYFVDRLYQNRGNAVLSRFPDETGYECFVNHIHMEDYTDEHFLETAFAVLKAINVMWRDSSYADLTVRHIISYDDTSCVYCFHIVRPGQSSLADNLDGYNEGVLFADCTFAKAN